VRVPLERRISGGEQKACALVAPFRVVNVKLNNQFAGVGGSRAREMKLSIEPLYEIQSASVRSMACTISTRNDHD